MLGNLTVFELQGILEDIEDMTEEEIASRTDRAIGRLPQKQWGKAIAAWEDMREAAHVLFLLRHGSMCPFDGAGIEAGHGISFDEASYMAELDWSQRLGDAEAVIRKMG